MEEKDLNNTQAVTEQDLNKNQPVTDTDLNNADAVNQQNQDGTLADGTDENKTVPYAKLKEAADARKAAEEQAQTLRDQMAILQANQQQAQIQTQPPKTTLELAMADVGVTADEMFGDVTVKVLNRKAELDMQLQQHQAAFSANSQFIAGHSDFTQVVGSVNPSTGAIMAWSQEALSLLQKKSYLAGAFQSAQGAYQAVMDERKLVELEKKATVNKEMQNRQGFDNASQPLGGSAAGAGTGGDNQNQQMMSREQVLEIEQKLESGEEV